MKNNYLKEVIIKVLLGICAACSVLAVGFMIVFLFYTAIPTIGKIGFFDFVFGDVWLPTAEEPLFGIRNLILTSLYGTAGAIIIGVPLGILAAVAIAQVLPKKISKIISPAVNLLAGIPSVIYGAVGAILLVPFVQKTFGLNTGATLFSAIIVLSIMVLPTIISVSATSLRAVPNTYMEASLALGLTKEMSLFRIIIPAAKSGIMTSVLLGLGRAIGEAMAIILVAGNVPGFPELFEPARFLTTGIVAEMGYAEDLHKDALFAIGAVLFVFILIINSLFYMIIKRTGKNNG
jgi:phosphate transport system permease protein